MQKTVVLGAGHWHLPLYRDAFLQHHEIVGVWDRSANAAARVESMSKTLGKTVVISSAFAQAYAKPLQPLGRFRLKDVEGEQELYTLPA